MSEQDNCAAKLEESQIVLCMVFPAHHQASEVIKPGKKSLDFPALSVASHPAPIIPRAVFTSLAMRTDQENPGLKEQLLAQAIAVVGSVGNQPQGQFGHKALDKRGFHQSYFSGRSSLRVDGDWKTSRVSNDHDFTTLAAPGVAHFESPFFAGAKLPSIKHSERSKPPRL